MAAISGSVSALRLLIENGGDVIKVDYKERPPFQWAVKQNREGSHKEVIAFLKEYKP